MYMYVEMTATREPACAKSLTSNTNDQECFLLPIKCFCLSSNANIKFFNSLIIAPWSLCCLLPLSTQIISFILLHFLHSFIPTNQMWTRLSQHPGHYITSPYADVSRFANVNVQLIVRTRHINPEDLFI